MPSAALWPWIKGRLSAALILVSLVPQASAEAINVDDHVHAQDIEIDSATLLIKRLSDGQTWVSNPDRVEQRYAPASTAKIPHTLLALENGLATPATLFRWDGVPKGPTAWNQDHTLASAFQQSVVWVYQEIVQTAGQQAMSAGLQSLDYGNADVGSAEQLTTYWLDNTLRISAQEQVAFLSKLALGQLPLSDTTYTAARDIMVTAKTPTWVMRAKTGWYFTESAMDIGWHVGWVECQAETYVFALNIDMPDSRSLSERTEITQAVLTEIGAFDCDKIQD